MATILSLEDDNKKLLAEVQALREFKEAHEKGEAYWLAVRATNEALRVEVDRLRGEVVGPMTDAGIYMRTDVDPTGPGEVRLAVNRLAGERDALRSMVAKLRTEVDDLNTTTARAMETLDKVERGKAAITADLNESLARERGWVDRLKAAEASCAESIQAATRVAFEEARKEVALRIDELLTANTRFHLERRTATAETAAARATLLAVERQRDALVIHLDAAWNAHEAATRAKAAGDIPMEPADPWAANPGAKPHPHPGTKTIGPVNALVIVLLEDERVCLSKAAKAYRLERMMKEKPTSIVEGILDRLDPRWRPAGETA